MEPVVRAGQMAAVLETAAFGRPTTGSSRFSQTAGSSVQVWKEVAALLP